MDHKKSEGLNMDHTKAEELKLIVRQMRQFMKLDSEWETFSELTDVLVEFETWGDDVLWLMPRIQKLAKSVLMMQLHGFAHVDWVSRQECDLWRDLQGGSPFLNHYLNGDDKKEILRLAEYAGGWFTWDDSIGGISFIEMAEWEKKYAVWLEDRDRELPTLEDLHAMKLRPPNGMTVEEMLDDLRGED
jgi:hypothetical protein